MSDRREVVVSGMRPTGRLHIGNYWGALKNWIALTERYDCYYFVADWHMLTTGYADTQALQANVREMALDWLAAGLDPKKCLIFKQSDVMEHAELALFLGMVAPLSWLENNPTWKEQLQELARTKLGKAEAGEEHKAAEGQAACRYEIRTFGFLGYPVLQAADIMLYQGNRVPVGQDQLPHLELSREIARRFNAVYGPVLAEPQPLLTQTPRIPGIDGRKMSKSYGNTLDLYETPESLSAKVMSMYTDPKKIRANDPGHPDSGLDNPPGCVVFALHKLYSPHWQARGEECRAGKIGCVACKKDLLKSMEGPFTEFRLKRERLDHEWDQVQGYLAQGAAKAQEKARATMSDIRRAMRLR